MTRAELISAIRAKRSYLCVGLDPDLDRLPPHIGRDAAGILDFNTEIIAATAPSCVAYKPNTAFYEALGGAGWDCLAETVRRMPADVLRIADAKRGDIGNTTRHYARAIFETVGADAVTVNPYMGSDSIIPFLEHEGKWVIVLAVTSNPSAEELEWHSDGQLRLFEKVLTLADRWGDPENLMFVAGATRPDELRRVRSLVPDHFLLIPGVGAQGGDLAAVSEASLTDDAGILVNSTRSIIYASHGEEFAAAAGREAGSMAHAMSDLLEVSR